MLINKKIILSCLLIPVGFFSTKAMAVYNCSSSWPYYASPTELKAIGYKDDKQLTVVNNTTKDLTISTPSSISTLVPVDTDSSMLIPAGGSKVFFFTLAANTIVNHYTACSDMTGDGNAQISFPVIKLNFKSKTTSCTVYGHTSFLSYGPVDVGMTSKDAGPITYSLPDKAEAYYLTYSGLSPPENKTQYMLSTPLAQKLTPSVKNESVTINLSSCDDTLANKIQIINKSTQALSKFTAANTSFMSDASSFWGNKNASLSSLGGSVKLYTTKMLPSIIPHTAFDKSANWSFSFIDGSQQKHTVAINLNNSIIPSVGTVLIDNPVFPPSYYRMSVGDEQLNPHYPASITSGYTGLLARINGEKVVAIVGYDGKENYYLGNATYITYDEKNASCSYPQLYPAGLRNALGGNKLIAAVNDGRHIFYFLSNKSYITKSVGSTSYSSPALISDTNWPGLLNAINGTTILSVFYDAQKKAYYFFLADGNYVKYFGGKVVEVTSVWGKGDWPAIGLYYLLDIKHYNVKFYANSEHIYDLVFKKANPDAFKAKVRKQTNMTNHNSIKNLGDDTVSQLVYAFYADGKYSLLWKTPSYNFDVEPGYPRPINQLFPGIPSSIVTKIVGVSQDPSSGLFYVFLDNNSYFTDYPNVAYNSSSLQSLASWGLSGGKLIATSSLINWTIGTTGNWVYEPRILLFITNGESLSFTTANIAAHTVDSWSGGLFNDVPNIFNISNPFGLHINGVFYSEADKKNAGGNKYNMRFIFNNSTEDATVTMQQTVSGYLQHNDAQVKWSDFGVDNGTNTPYYPGLLRFKNKILCKDLNTKNPISCSVEVLSSPSGKTLQFSLS